jgi:hypothetical protein
MSDKHISDDVRIFVFASCLSLVLVEKLCSVGPGVRISLVSACKSLQECTASVLNFTWGPRARVIHYSC